MLEDLELDRRLRLGLDSLGLDQSTPVQERAIPAALKGKDLAISAATGSGKTLAYLIPLVQRLLGENATGHDGPPGLILVPTRELARQVLKQCRSLLAKTPLQVYAITGGADFKYQRALFRKAPEIIVATPGRMLEHCERKSSNLHAVKLLILDEADRMLDMGFREDVLAIHGACTDLDQVLLVSATLNHRGLGSISRALLKDAETIAIDPARQAHGAIDHQVVLADSTEHKDKLLVALLAGSSWSRVLVFANKRSTAIRLAGLVKHHKLRAACLHGEMSTEDRRDVVTRLNDGKLSVVCASDLAARGLDIANLDVVINYDLPHSGDDYLHRSGRTGRAGAHGLAISMVTASTWNLMISIERYLSLDFKRRSLPGLKPRFNGPKKQKGSGKAAGSKRKKIKSKEVKAKSRKRNKKSLGKPSHNPTNATQNDGFAPLMKKRPPEKA